MSRHPVLSASEIATRANEVRERFVAEGVNIAEWARERGFSGDLVHRVLSGTRKCRRGESHRIAVALGIKPKPSGDQASADQLQGVRP